MSDSPQSASSRDEEIVRLLRAGDEAGLRNLLREHAPRVQWWLRSEFAGSLHDTELDEAMNLAAHSAWRSARTFDPTRGTLRAWFYVIARNSLRTVLRRESKERRGRVQLDVELAGTLQRAPAAATGSAGNRDFVADLQRCIAQLPRLQRAIIEADLRHGDVADAGELAREHGTTKNSIYASRSIARKALRTRLRALGHDMESHEAKEDGHAS